MTELETIIHLKESDLCNQIFSLGKTDQYQRLHLVNFKKAHQIYKHLSFPQKKTSTSSEAIHNNLFMFPP